MNITDILGEFEKIDNWGNATKVAVACLAFGYIWKSIKLKWLPNEAIPPAVMLFGAGLFTAVSAYSTEYIQTPGWYLSSALTGLAVGFVTVLGHNYGLKFAEDYLATKYSVVAKFLGKEAQKDPAPPEPAPKP